MNAEKYYTEKKERITDDLSRLKHKQTLSSVFRLVVFLMSVSSFFIILKINLTIAISFSLLLFIIFLFLVKKHIALQKKRRYFESYNSILRGELDACKNNFSSFKKGLEYEDHHHNYSYDLDVFGKGSVFQMLNRTVTKKGEMLLALNLTDNFVSKENILELQEGIKELSVNPEIQLHFRATGETSDIEEDKTESLISWGVMHSIFKGKTLFKIFIYVLPALTLLSLIFLTLNLVDSSLFVLLFILNLFIVSINLRKISKEHNKISSYLKYLQKYQGLLSIIENTNFNSIILKQSVEKLKEGKETAGEILLKLTKLTSAFDNRLNFIAAIFLEGVLLWDYHCLFALEKWKKSYGKQLAVWLEQVSFFDVLISKSTYAYNNNKYVYPIISNKNILKAEGLGHPLIPASVRVSNDFVIDNKGAFVIITGANMAGKSTFLRTVGVNLTLAKAGMPVCAENFEFVPLKLYTSMRTSDSLAENESYFYAELLRLKELLDKLEAGEELFIILDEILKGTNSVDKQKGSQLTLEKIIKLGGTGIIATHDLALTKIEDKFPANIQNKCFEIEIDNARISFDYKLYEGVTQKMNAMLLMEQMNII